jgi:hypothetical protein
VIAGFKWAPLAAADIKTATNTEMAQPKVITIHPPLFPYVLFNTTLATTPLPNKIKMAVPMNSEIKGVIQLELVYNMAI